MKICHIKVDNNPTNNKNWSMKNDQLNKAEAEKAMSLLQSSNPQPCAPIFWQATLFGFPLPWYSGWMVKWRSDFEAVALLWFGAI